MTGSGSAGTSGYFHHLVINKSTGISVTQKGNLGYQSVGNLTVENGIFNLNGFSDFVTGDLTVNDAGVLSMPSYSILTFANLKKL